MNLFVIGIDLERFGFGLESGPSLDDRGPGLTPVLLSSALPIEAALEIESIRLRAATAARWKPTDTDWDDCYL